MIGKKEGMVIMSNLILSIEKLFKDNKAKCPKCKSGYLKPMYPEHKKPYDFKCSYCGYYIHFEPSVVVE